LKLEKPNRVAFGDCAQRCAMKDGENAVPARSLDVRAITSEAVTFGGVLTSGEA
jgi:hypothetical protein